jgi:hypothetical protein
LIVDERFAPANPTAAEDNIAVVYYRGLSGRNGALRLMQANSRAIVFGRCNG